MTALTVLRMLLVAGIVASASTSISRASTKPVAKSTTRSTRARALELEPGNAEATAMRRRLQGSR
jgi:hypothetical protein